MPQEIRRKETFIIQSPLIREHLPVEKCHSAFSHLLVLDFHSESDEIGKEVQSVIFPIIQEL